MLRYFILMLLCYTSVAQSQNLDTFFETADAFFSTYVKNGKVAYAQLHKNPADLDALIQLAETITVNETDADNYQAFWINAYNLATIKGIVDNYPIQSPLDKNGFFDKIAYNLGGKHITLNDIENKLLRAKFNDARVHFVLVCGAVGCPPLINKAYKPETLDAQLTTQTQKAINGNFIKVNAKKKRVEVSQIMEWYKDDFVQNGSEIDFLNQYRTEKIPSKYKLSYFQYNWALNAQ